VDRLLDETPLSAQIIRGRRVVQIDDLDRARRLPVGAVGRTTS